MLEGDDEPIGAPGALGVAPHCEANQVLTANTAEPPAVGHFDAALLGRRGCDFVFGTDPAAVATALRALADRIESGVAVLIKLHTGSFLRPDDFSERSLLIRYVEKVTS